MDLICIDLRHLRLFEDTRRDLTSQAWREVIQDVTLTILSFLEHSTYQLVCFVSGADVFYMFPQVWIFEYVIFFKSRLVEFEEEDALAAMKRRDEDIEKQLSEASAACPVTSCEVKNEWMSEEWIEWIENDRNLRQSQQSRCKLDQYIDLWKTM